MSAVRSSFRDVEAAVAAADSALAAGRTDAASAALDTVETTPGAAATDPEEGDRETVLALARHRLARHRLGLATGLPDPEHAQTAVRLLGRLAREDADGSANALLAEAAVACCAGASLLLRARMVIVAQRAARAALARDPSHGEAHAALGLLALHSPGAAETRAAAAREHLAEAVRLQPGRIDWRAWLARACLEMKDEAAARRETDLLRSVLPAGPAEALITSVVGASGACATSEGSGAVAPELAREGGSSPKPSPDGAAAILVRGAARGFAGRSVLRGVDLRVAPGEIVGLVGPNGAGKSTLLGAIAGRVRLDAGDVAVLGERVIAGRFPKGLGYAPQAVGLYPLLTVAEHLRCFARLHRLGRAAAERSVAIALDWSGLEAQANQLARTLSGGMRRRLAIALAAVHAPRALLLDEPLTGIDASHRERIWAMLRARAAGGVAILCAAPHPDDVRGRIDRVVPLECVAAAAGSSGSAPACSRPGSGSGDATADRVTSRPGGAPEEAPRCCSH